MCQAGMHVWMVLESGSLKAVSVLTFMIERQIEELEARDDLVQIISLNNHTASTSLVLAYKNGHIALIKSSSKFAPGIEVKSLGIDILSKLENKLSTIKLASSQLYAIEKSHLFEVWCGCDNSTIEIVSLNNETSKVQFNTHSSSADIPQDASIIQLRSSFNMAAHMMYALHSCGSVISCWSVCEQPVLNNVIKLTQLSSPGR